MAGAQIGAAAVTTTTTTGTGTLTISNTVPTGQPSGSQTFAATFAPSGTYPVPNIFYAIQDALGNYEAGYGTLTSATTLTRDFVIFSGTANPAGYGAVPQFVQSPTSSFLNLAAGTATVYSNPAIQAAFTPYQSRFPNFSGNNAAGPDGGITEDIMSGSFTATVTATAATNTGTVFYKVSSNGVVSLEIPTALTATAGGTGALTLTGIPSYLTNVTSQAVPCITQAGAGNLAPSLVTVTGGATPTATGTLTAQYAPVATGFFTATYPASANGFPAQTITWALK